MDRLFSDLMLLVGFCMIAGGMLRSARDILIVTSLRHRHESHRGKPGA
jgi:hypothetical protein